MKLSCKLIGFLSVLCLLASHRAEAQENLIANGGFEEFSSSRPKHWSMPNQLAASQKEGSRPGGSGKYVLRLYATGGSFYTKDPNNPGVSGGAKVESGKTYRLSFWYKGANKGLSFGVQFSWYKGKEFRSRSEWIEVKVNETDKWTNEVSSITVPDDVDTGELKFRIDRHSSSGQLFFDDVEFYLEGGDVPQAILPPANIRTTEVFQREAMITWEAASDPNTSWEVWVKNKSNQYELYKVVQENKCMLEHLSPGSPTLFKVLTVREGKKSALSQENTIMTKPLEKVKTDPARTPYLRTIKGSGNSPRKIKAYFNDIAADDAVVTYTMDGKPIELEDNSIVFPSAGVHWLVITIDEKDGNRWKLTYRVYVTD